MNALRLACAASGLLLAGLALGALRAAPAAPAADPLLPFSCCTDTPAREPSAVPQDTPLAAPAPPAATRSLPGDDSSPPRPRVLEGRVELGASPADPSLAVVLLGGWREERDGGERGWELREELARAPVSKDGRFRLALPERVNADARPAPAVDLDGRWLYLDQALPLDALLAEADPVLRPELGGALRVRLGADEDSAEAPSIARADVGCLGGSPSVGMGLRTRVVDGGGDIELRALPPSANYTVWATANDRPTAHREDVVVEPGRETTLVLNLERGASVHGRVVDDAGRPVANAAVVGDVGAHESNRIEAGRTRTDDQGRFALEGLAPGVQRLAAQALDHMDGESADLALSEGERLDDVLIELASGSAVAGRVLWPDGTPAANARVCVLPRQPGDGAWRQYERARSEDAPTLSDAAGAFRVAGLTPGEYAVWVCASDERRVEWSARLDACTADEGGLELVLAAPEACGGRVRDDAGRPVGSFRILARRADWPAWADGPWNEREASFEAADGRFALKGLDRGAWSLFVLAEEHLAGEELRVQVPCTGVELALTRTASFAGTVRDPEGRPVAGAEVRARCDSPAGRGGSAVSGADGGYTLSGVGPGKLVVEASSESFAPSESLRFELAAGEARTHVDPQLTNGGRLEGRVYDADGAPDGRALVALQSPLGDTVETKTDAAGRFAFEHLRPGPVQVFATPQDDDWAFTPDADLGEVFRELRTGVATIVADETVEFVLGAPPRAPVIVHGRVTRDGQPLARANLMLLAEGGSLFEGMHADTTDADGQYEIRLDEPGEYTALVLGTSEASFELDFPATIPPVERYALDLAVPAGALRGRVLAPDGGAAPGAVVWLRREDGTSSYSSAFVGGAVDVADDGTFAIEPLNPGRYALTATASDLAMTTLHDVVVPKEGQAEPVELVVPRAGRVLGHVRDAAGEPVLGAVVQAWDADGRVLHHLSADTDGDGAFTLERVPAGVVLLAAETAEGGASEAVRVQIAVDDEAHVELALVPSTFLRVRFEDDEDRPCRAALSVLGEDGREHANLGEWTEDQAFDAHALAPNERRLGPLLPGRYTVRAQAPDGSHAERTVTLHADNEERSLRLRLKP